jgi:hypothetical protein
MAKDTTATRSHTALIKILHLSRPLTRRDRRFLLHHLADAEYRDDRVEELEEEQAKKEKRT